MQRQACIFDLDGTLLNTLEDLAFATNQALEYYGLPTHDLETICSFVGEGVVRLVWRAAPPESDSALKDKLLERFLEVYERERVRRTVPYPGIVDLLETLKLSGFALGVFSNKMHDATQAMCDHYFPGIFDEVLGYNPGENPLKPAPDGLIRMMDALGVGPADTTYIGDSIVDIQTACAAEVPVLACAWGFAGREALEDQGALAVLSVPEDALPYLLSPSIKEG